MLSLFLSFFDSVLDILELALNDNLLGNRNNRVSHIPKLLKPGKKSGNLKKD